MKAAERKKRKMQEKSKLSSDLMEDLMPKKKLTTVSSHKNDIKGHGYEINNDNIIQNIPASRPANNEDVDKISQRLKERKERRKRKKMVEEGINPTFIINDDNNNINNINDISLNSVNNIHNNNINSNNTNNNQKDINNNNGNINKNNFNSDKDSNKLVQSVESVAPVPMPKKVNFHIPSIKNISIIESNINVATNLNNNNNNININYNNLNQKQNSNSSSSSSYNNKNDIISLTSTTSYHLLSKNFAQIKNENIEEFLTKTNPNKPSNEEKESEVQKMIEVMKLHPNPRNVNNKANIKDENNYAHNLIQKIEDNSEYYENQRELKELREKVKEEEKKTEQMLQRNKEEIQKYIEKIISLQNNLINSQQGDIVTLEESIKIDLIQINNLTVTYHRLKEENEKEKNKMMNLINKEIIPLQKELKNEINEVQKLKSQLKLWNKKAPPRDLLKKVEVIMKYMKNCV